MTVELQPKGLDCNLGCSYCYQNPQREAGNTNASEYDLQAMVDAIPENPGSISLFGGEVLLAPEDDLRFLLDKASEYTSDLSINTNGVLLNESHIQLFEEYGVEVTVSIDGPGSLNQLRRSKTKRSTENATEKTEENIKKLADSDLRVGLIACVHKVNAGTQKKLSQMMDFFDHWNRNGIHSTHFHITGGPSTPASVYLDGGEASDVFLELAKFHEKKPEINWVPFQPIKRLIGYGEVGAFSCVWQHCDPMNTQAVDGIDGQGNHRACERIGDEGIDWIKSDDVEFERYQSLRQTPQDMGGCKDCRFWSLCRGRDPCRGENGEWRNRTSFCSVVKTLFGFYEDFHRARGRDPITDNDDFMNKLETLVNRQFDKNNNFNLADLVEAAGISYDS